MNAVSNFAFKLIIGFYHPEIAGLQDDFKTKYQIVTTKKLVPNYNMYVDMYAYIDMDRDCT